MFSQPEGGGGAKDDNTWSSEKVRLWKAAAEEGPNRRVKELRPNSSVGPDNGGVVGVSSDQANKSRKRKAKEGTNNNKMSKRAKEGPSQNQETTLNNRDRETNKKQKKTSSSVVEVVSKTSKAGVVVPLEKKRKLQEKDQRGVADQRRGNNSERHPNKKAPSLKKKEKKSSVDVHDKLDKLIEQYRSKFAQQNSSDGQKQSASKKLKRWFES